MQESRAQAALKYAGFWVRLVATLIDSILLAAIVAAILIPLVISRFGEQFEQLAGSTDRQAMEGVGLQIIGFLNGPVGVLVQWVLPAVLVIVFWKWRSATPGKMVLGLKIVDARTGGKPGTGQLIGRYFAYLASMIPLCLGFLWIAFDERKQAWHDKLAGTLVVYGK